MPNPEKVKTVAQIKEDIQSADVVWVVDYRGLSVKQAEELRRRIRAEDAAYRIYKNTFTIRALDELDYPELGEVLQGPSAFVFANGDPVGSAKALKAFAKENEVLKIKGGLLDGAVLSAKQVEAIAELPSREELVARLLGTISRPLSGLVYVLNGTQQQFVRALKAIAENKAA
ncbi:MAG: 50S ribosomal protein L10 [Coriobacteriales bacterium]|jgi:large subunit ribosomal protein L10|nr:50S ribosomal protein L10 [Coriobacteriales bacterium]